MAGLYCCLTVRFLLWSTTKGLSLHSTGVSPEGWWIFNRSLYFFSLSQRNWTASREDCLQRNADLVVINTKVEEVTEALSVCVCLCGYIRHSARCVFMIFSYLKQQFYAMCPKILENTWIGLRLDRDTEGTWKWVDGTNVT